MRKNIIILILLTIFCLSVSISSVSANENLTNDIVCNDAGNILSSDTQENLEIESDHAHLE